MMVGVRALFRVCCLAGATVGLNSLADAQAGTVPFLAHQAIYNLSLQQARGNASVNDARGSILYKFSGNACEGYVTEFHQVSQLDSGEDKTTVSDLRSTSWEDASGKSYRFKIESRTNDGDPSNVDGVAERSDDGTITVRLKQPQTKVLTLDKATVFPTEQIRRIIEAAKAGQHVLQLNVYDGSDNGEKLYSTLTVIGRPIAGDKAPKKPDVSTTTDKLKYLTRWPVTVSYFDQSAKSGTGEQTPSYAMSFELYEDGVSRALVLDYNDFVLSGTMDKIEINDSKPCK